MSLKEIIIQRIKEDGPLSFRDYMDMCLYHPGLGYYTSPGERIGQNGDYFTSCSTGNLFGEMIAIQLNEMWECMGKPPFTIVEYGAGDASLCISILEALRYNEKLYDQLSYCIIEKRPLTALKSVDHEKITIVDQPDQLKGLQGCILSNELVDNFAVHQVLMQDELMEIYVDYDKGQFRELFQPAACQLNEYFCEINVQLPVNYRTEVNLEAISWINQTAAILDRGFIITIDYGFPSIELYSNARRKGTLLCYYGHTVHDCPYEHIGDQDITSHINFSALEYWGQKSGLVLSGYTNQAYFLMGLGIGRISRQNKIKDPSLANVLLRDLGTRLNVMIQQKNMTPQPLSGLRFPLKLN
jgi:SAM-dependent MidA family methyltransferase